MPDKTPRERRSLYNDHLRILGLDDSKATLDSHQLKEKQHIESLELPPLRLQEKVESSPSWLSWLLAPKQMGLSVGLAFSLIFAVMILKQPKDHLTPKGAIRVSVFWERDGKVAPFTAETQLKDGDRVGSSVLSAEEAVAYWAISDNQFKVISDLNDIHTSRIELQPGVSQNFASSFTLVAPNQGEHLIVIVCPKGENQKHSPEGNVTSVFNQEFVSKLVAKGQAETSNCMYIGYRLRRLATK